MSNTTFKLFSDLEKLMIDVEKRWQKQNFSTESFPDIVWEITRNIDLSDLGEVSNQLQLFDIPSVRLLQKRSTFSDLYTQIYHNGRFMIEILNWWGGHVNVHDHDFSAVQFQLKGNALNVPYAFNTIENEGAIRFGDLKVATAEIWKEGGRSIVRHGQDSLHGVFHLGEPTTSLLIRTIPTPRYGAQSNYFPSLAGHYYVSNDLLRKKMTALSLLSKQNEKEFRYHLKKFLSSQSLSESFFMLLKLGEITFQEKYSDLMIDYAQQGEKQSRVVENVIYNNGIDFFKSAVNNSLNLSQNEKIAAFAVASSCNLENFSKIEKCLEEHLPTSDLRSSLFRFINQLEKDDQKTADKYLDVFNLKGIIDEKI